MSAASMWNEDVCVVCGVQLESRNLGRPSRYCSRACRQRAYRVRRDDADRAASGDPGAPSEGTAVVPAAAEPVDREVPHLTQRQLLAWRGMLEVESRILPLLDGDLQRQMGLTINEFDVLYQLWTAPDLRRRMNHLANAVLVTPSGITRIVARLEQRGLVERASMTGRQAVEAILTADGEHTLQQAMDVHFLGVRRLFVDNISDTDVTRLASLWRRVRRAIVSSTGS